MGGREREKENPETDKFSVLVMVFYLCQSNEASSNKKTKMGETGSC